MKILYLSLNPNLRGPVPKIDPVLIASLTDLGCQITKSTWGRHTDRESILQKISGRFTDLRSATSALAGSRYDILYVATTLDAHALYRDVPLLLATRRLPVQKVLMEHGSNTDPLALPGHHPYKLMTRLLIRLSDAILLLSNEELENWRAFEPKGKYYRVDNPFVSADRPVARATVHKAGSTRSSPTLLFVGRLIRAKGIFDLLDAMQIIVHRRPCKLVIAGDGEEMSEIERRVDEKGLRESVSLRGYVPTPELGGLYENASLFVLPTYFGEGFPMAIMEAMGHGLPIITTACRGVRDHLREGENALFVQPEDADSIARAVLRLLDDVPLSSAMGHANLVKMREFAPENIAPKYLGIFHELLDSTFP